VLKFKKIIPAPKGYRVRIFNDENNKINTEILSIKMTVRVAISKHNPKYKTVEKKQLSRTAKNSINLFE
jgi:hypothetical protein